MVVVNQEVLLPIAATTLETEEIRSGDKSWRYVLFGTKSLQVGLMGLGAIVLIAIFAPLVVGHDPTTQSLANRRLPPIWHGWFYGDLKANLNFPLGTDKLGRDYWARLAYGSRVSLLVGVSAAFFAGAIGTFMGVCAGYFGGKVDSVVSFLITVRLSIPIILIALAAVGLYGGSLTVIITVMGVCLWDRFAIVMRTATQQIRSKDYIHAALAAGQSLPGVVLTELLPNVAGLLIIVATIEMANAILFEAALSFLGMGVQPPTVSWGLMLAEGRPDIFYAPWYITIPGLALFLLVLCVNLLGDGIRDATAPNQRV